MSPLFFLNNGSPQVRTSPFQTVKGKIIDLLFKESLLLFRTIVIVYCYLESLTLSSIMNSSNFI